MHKTLFRICDREAYVSWCKAYGSYRPWASIGFGNISLEYEETSRHRVLWLNHMGDNLISVYVRKFFTQKKREVKF